MPGIGVISNPNAGLNKLSPRIKNRLTFVVGQGGEVVSTGTLDDAEAAARAFKEFEIDVVAISGGDGTAHRTIELLLDVYDETPLPPILLLPSGTQNMVPGSFGLRGNAVSTMLLTLARYRHNVPLRCVKRNMLQVNGHHSFMFGIGVAPRFLELYYSRGMTSMSGAARLIGEVALDAARGGEVAARLAEHFEIEYRLDEGPPRHKSVHSLFCSFVEELSLRFKPFPRAGWDANVFEIALIDGHPVKVVQMLHRIWFGAVKLNTAFTRHMARSMEVRLDRPEPYTLDGEVYEAIDRFEISAGPELNFVVPGLKLRRDPHIRTTEAGPWSMRYLL